jgi:hypothetical protein
MITAWFSHNQNFKLVKLSSYVRKSVLSPNFVFFTFWLSLCIRPAGSHKRKEQLIKLRLIKNLHRVMKSLDDCYALQDESQ